MLRRPPLLIAAVLICTIMCSPAFATEMTESESRAVEILGPGKVLGYRDVCRVQKAKLPDVEPTMSFSEDVLRECAKANAEGTANWRLAYVTGHSLRQEYEVMGWNRKKQPCFDPDLTWWLDKAQDSWATRTIKPGYRLLDFTKRFPSVSKGWQAQSDEIAKLGPNYERAEEQAVTEVCFSNFLLSPNKERLLPNWYHWGKLQTADGFYVYVGSLLEDGFFVWFFNPLGYQVNFHWFDYSHDALGVVLARKP